MFSSDNVLVEGNATGDQHTSFDFATPLTAPQLLITIDYSNLVGSQQDNIGIDNIRFGQNPPAEIPEPATWLLFICGLAAVGFCKWSSRRFHGIRVSVCKMHARCMPGRFRVSGTICTGFACQGHATPAAQTWSDACAAIGSDTLGTTGRENNDPEWVEQFAPIVALLQSAVILGPSTPGPPLTRRPGLWNCMPWHAQSDEHHAAIA